MILVIWLHLSGRIQSQSAALILLLNVKLFGLMVFEEVKTMLFVSFVSIFDALQILKHQVANISVQIVLVPYRITYNLLQVAASDTTDVVKCSST